MWMFFLCFWEQVAALPCRPSQDIVPFLRAWLLSGKGAALLPGRSPCILAQLLTTLMAADGRGQK